MAVNPAAGGDSAVTIEEIKALLAVLNFPERRLTDQTAICVLALADHSPRAGLLPGHRSLSAGARIHDILNFVRRDLGRPVAENTRESYRKDSLRPLMDARLITRHQLSTNDPNTFYCLHQDFADLLVETNAERRSQLIERLRLPALVSHYPRRRTLDEDIVVRLNGETFTLSRGVHNLLEQAVVEVFGPKFLDTPEVVYLGDTAPRQGFQNRALMRRLNLPIDITASLPDVILYSAAQRHLVIVEAVISGGAIDSTRLNQLRQFSSGAAALDNRISYVSAFPSRSVLRRFIEIIGWGTKLWIEAEPDCLIDFQTGL
ncbi:MAG: hypothetical protein FJZ89_03940 [Chloroflexi bacterium]|nr:hypothetical protein [Chloroflexota bacterium]